MPLRRFWVTFEPGGRRVEVDEGSTILDAARSIDLDLDHVCGGCCSCATCHVIVREGHEHLEQRSEDEIAMLETADGQTELSRLACQTEVMADLRVKIPS